MNIVFGPAPPWNAGSKSHFIEFLWPRSFVADGLAQHRFTTFDGGKCTSGLAHQRSIAQAMKGVHVVAGPTSSDMFTLSPRRSDSAFVEQLARRCVSTRGWSVILVVSTFGSLEEIHGLCSEQQADLVSILDQRAASLQQEVKTELQGEVKHFLDNRLAGTLSPRRKQTDEECRRDGERALLHRRRRPAADPRVLRLRASVTHTHTRFRAFGR